MYELSKVSQDQQPHCAYPVSSCYWVLGVRDTGSGKGTKVNMAAKHLKASWKYFYRKPLTPRETNIIYTSKGLRKYPGKQKSAQFNYFTVKSFSIEFNFHGSLESQRQNSKGCFDLMSLQQTVFLSILCLHCGF